MSAEPVRVNKLDAELVSQLFRVMLGRDPESDTTIANHIAKGTIPGVVAHIMSSKEFRDRYSNTTKTNTNYYIQKFVDAQISPWVSKSNQSVKFHKNIDKILAMKNKIAFRLSGSTIETMDKPGTAYYNEGRLSIYKEMLQEALKIYPVSLSCTIVLDVADLAEESLEFPVFSFQKKSGSVNILLPDIDMAGHNYLGDSQVDKPYLSKINRACFAGATTSCRVITMDIAEQLSTRGCYGPVRPGIQMRRHDLFARRLSVRCFR